jgi:hypothetical protein
VLATTRTYGCVGPMRHPSRQSIVTSSFVHPSHRMIFASSSLPYPPRVAHSQAAASSRSAVEQRGAPRFLEQGCLLPEGMLAQHLVPQGVIWSSPLQMQQGLLSVDVPDACTAVCPMLSSYLQAPAGSLPGSRLSQTMGAFEPSHGALGALVSAAERRAQESDAEVCQLEPQEAAAEHGAAEEIEEKADEADEEAEVLEYYSDEDATFEPDKYAEVLARYSSEGADVDASESDEANGSTARRATSCKRRARELDDSNEDTQSDSSSTEGA